MKILVTGCHGQVGWELARSLLPLGEVIAVTRQQIDLAQPEQLRQSIRSMGPDVIVNAAAYTAVDKAEQEFELAEKINSTAPGIMGDEMAKKNGLLVHYSTDYVFDGSLGRPYREGDQTAPVNKYGQTKLAGEGAIRASGGDFLIFRTSWVYASRGHNFVKTVLRLATEKEELKIVADQQGTPTWARSIADTTAHAVKQSLMEKSEDQFVSGLYHLTATGSTSWHGFSEAIVDLARQRGKFEVKTRHITPIPTSDYQLPAQRPKNSRLEIDKLEQKFGLKMPHWLAALKLCMEEV